MAASASSIATIATIPAIPAIPAIHVVPQIEPDEVNKAIETKATDAKREIGIFAAGCFWKPDGVLRKMMVEFPGMILDSKPVYVGGVRRADGKPPTYREVCSGTSGHAEGVRFVFDSRLISWREVLTVFFGIHDPTTLNKQGPDEGKQYRSAIFPINAEQKSIALECIKDLISNHKIAVTTTVEDIVDEAKDCHIAEPEHWDYISAHPERACAYSRGHPVTKSKYNDLRVVLKQRTL